MIVGHVYYFLKDVYPELTGREPLVTPAIICALFGQRAATRVETRGVLEREPPMPVRERREAHED